jgi:hypothetical protein
VNGIAALTRGAEMQVRILELAHAGLHDEEIAVLLTQEGHRSPTCPDREHPTTVQRIRLAAGVRIATQRTRWRHGPGQLGVTAMAARMGIPAKWLYVQIRSGRILIDRQPSGAYLFDDTPETVDILLSLRNRAVSASIYGHVSLPKRGSAMNDREDNSAAPPIPPPRRRPGSAR